MNYPPFHSILKSKSAVAPSSGSVCGKSAVKSMNGDDRIAGGSAAIPNEFPWQALLTLYIAGSDNPLGYCGGTLISDTWILTSATCLNGYIQMKHQSHLSFSFNDRSW